LNAAVFNGDEGAPPRKKAIERKKANTYIKTKKGSRKTHS